MSFGSSAGLTMYGSVGRRTFSSAVPTPGGSVKFLLTSAGIKNSSINDALLDLLGKPIAECDALCIPTASYGHAPGGIRGAYRFISGQATTPMCELGWKSLGVLELTALPTLDRTLWLPLVEEIDVLLVNGGDSLYLAHHMLESGLADLLPSLSAVWVGLSAGSMVMTPRIGEDFKVWNPPVGTARWGSSISRSSRTWITRICRRTTWPRQNDGLPASHIRQTH